MTILGARPQFVKAGTVSREINKFNDIREIIVHTGQHYDKNMSEIFFEEMKIPKPKYFLGVGGKSHGAMTGQMIEKIEDIALKEKPDWILVYGDTNSTLAGALVASKLHIKLAHVEAGLRSFNMKMPEEVNRVLTDRISDVLFCPTDTAVNNLKNEKYDNFNCKIVKSGDVMYDAVLYYKQFARKPRNVKIEKDFILCTIHRAENTDNLNKLKNIFEALADIGKDIQIILPLHPRTKQKLNDLSLSFCNINIIEPIGYFEMLWLLKNSKMVMTDSGGLQKEAYFFKKPCITLREETEWIELLEIGINKLVGANKEKIIKGYKYFSDKMLDIKDKDLYGNGKAAKKIIMELLN